MNVVIQKKLDGKWFKINDNEVKKQEAIQERKWLKYRNELTGKKIGLRHLSFIINNFPTRGAYNFCRNNIRLIYSNLVEESSLTAIAGRPLYYLYEAPKLNDLKMPSYSNVKYNQCYINSSYSSRLGISNKLLICTTSRTHTLSMPLTVFHAYASKYFNAILYFFDTSKNHYRGMNESLLSSAEKMIKNLSPSSVSFCGTSAGACPAIGLYLANKGSRVAVGSPIFDAHSDITERLLNADKFLLRQSFLATFAENAIDMRFKEIYNRLSRITSNQNICNMSKISSSHASLGSTIITGDFDKILSWLSFNNTEIKN